MAHPDSVVDLQEARASALERCLEDAGLNWHGNYVAMTLYRCAANICSRLESLEEAIREKRDDPA